MPTPKCEICDDDFSSEDGDHSPRNLKCCHTLCEGCIKKLLNNHRIVCPFCREPTDLPGNNIKSLHKNFSLIQVIQLMTKNIEVEECEASFIPKCKAHSYNLAEFICVNAECSSDDKLMCRTCEDFGVHKGHEKDLLITRMETSRKSLHKATRDLQRQVQDIDQSVEAVKKSQTALLESGELFQKKANEITTFYSKLREKVNEREEEGLSKLKEVAHSAWVEKEMSLPPLLESRKNINKLVIEANEIMKRSNATSFCDIEALLEKTKTLSCNSFCNRKKRFLFFSEPEIEISPRECSEPNSLSDVRVNIESIEVPVANIVYGDKTRRSFYRTVDFSSTVDSSRDFSRRNKNIFFRELP